MNVITAHKDELEKLLEHLSSDRVISGITFEALVDAYIMRLDTNCPDISAGMNAPPGQIGLNLLYGTNIDLKLRALLRAIYNCRTARGAFPKISRCAPQAAVNIHRRLTRDDALDVRRIICRPAIINDSSAILG